MVTDIQPNARRNLLNHGVHRLAWRGQDSLCVNEAVVGMRPQRQEFIAKRLCQLFPGSPAGRIKHIHFRVGKGLQGGWRFGSGGRRRYHLPVPVIGGSTPIIQTTGFAPITECSRENGQTSPSF